MQPGKRVLYFLLPTFQDILFVATLGGAFLLGQRMLRIDSDLGRHLALGRYMLETGIIPTKDLFSHTLPGMDRPPYEWLSQVSFSLANELAGLDGVILLVCLLIALAFGFVYGQAVKRSGLPVLSLFLAVLAMAASSLHWLPRPHVITFLFLAVQLERLETIQSGGKVPLWQLPALMLLWANLHGGFVFGFLAWLAYAVGWRWERWIQKPGPGSATGRQLWSGLLLAGIASVITPDGWGNWQGVIANHSRYILSQTIETMPPNFRQTSTWPFFLLLCLSVVLFLLTWKQTRASHVFLLGGLAGMGLLMARNIPLFVVAAAPVLALWARNALERWNFSRLWLTIEKRIMALQDPLRGKLWPVLFGVGLVLLIGDRQMVQKEASFQFDSDVFPVQAADWLEAHPQAGLMFNEFNWGGYLLYRLWPGQRVFLDSQTDFYGEPLVREYEQAITASPGWEDVLARHHVAWVILAPTARLAGVLHNSNDWEMIYQDETAIIARKLIR